MIPERGIRSRPFCAPESVVQGRGPRTCKLPFVHRVLAGAQTTEIGINPSFPRGSPNVGFRHQPTFAGSITLPIQRARLAAFRNSIRDNGRSAPREIRDGRSVEVAVTTADASDCALVPRRPCPIDSVKHGGGRDRREPQWLPLRSDYHPPFDGGMDPEDVTRAKLPNID